MLYDAAFAHAVYADRDAALAGLDLTRAERDALIRPDARAYATDPYRRARALHGLLAEYPASAWLASRATRDVRALDAFFSAPEFHDCIATRGSLAAAFGAYLQRAPLGERIVPLARLEATIARVRRAVLQPLRYAASPQLRHDTPTTTRYAPHPPLRHAHHPPERGNDLLTLSPRHAVVELPIGAAAFYEVVACHVRSGGDDVSAFLLRDPTAASHFDLSFDASGFEFLHLQGTAEGDVAIASATPELAQLLLLAADGCTRTALASQASTLGAEPDEVHAIIEDLLLEGILIP